MSQQIIFERKVNYDNKFEVTVSLNKGSITVEDQTTIATAIESIRTVMEPYFQEVQKVIDNQSKTK